MAAISVANYEYFGNLPCFAHQYSKRYVMDIIVY
jgi:hypothetical protein